jgi:hypothetical protein
MDFRAPGQSNERRRRVRSDEAVAGAVPMRSQARSDEPAARARRSGRYADSGRPERQARIVDLVLRRILWQNIVAVVGIAAIGLLLAGHWATHATSREVPPATARAFDATAGDSFAGWIRAGMLAAAAFGAMTVFVVRRHRTDDYRGGYRIWAWAAAWMLAMSADSIAGLRDALRAMASAEFQWAGPADGMLWWAMPCLLAAVTIGVRLVMDMRECRTSSVWLGIGTTLWTAGEAVRMGAVWGMERLTMDLIAAGSSLAGQWCLFMAMSWHARHVVLDASGELRARKKKKKARAEETQTEERETAPQKREATTVAAKKPEPPRQTSPAPQQAQQNTIKPPSNSSPGTSNLAATLTFGGRASQASAQNPQLSKAERKQLKRDVRRAA